MLRGKFDLPHDVIAEDCRRLVDEVKSRHGDNPQRNYTTYFDEDLRQATHELPWYSDFSDIAKDTYIKFINYSYNIPVSHLNRDDIHLFAWISVYNKQHHHEIHNHFQCHVSGTYYVKCTREDQPIKFINPAFLSNATLLAKDESHISPNDDKLILSGTEGNTNEAIFLNETGDFLMWPSQLQHGVPFTDNQSKDYERIAISFNFKHRLELDNNNTGTNMSYGNHFND